jgi:hypothetical protein
MRKSVACRLLNRDDEKVSRKKAKKDLVGKEKGLTFALAFENESNAH